MGPTPLPAFPEAPYLYHYGASAFFLDRADGLKLSPQQRSGLTAVRTKAQREMADADAVVTRAEGELWALTGAAAPDAVAVAATLDEIGRLRSAQRLAYIRHVGEAARLLTEEQRRQLVRADGAGTTRKAALAAPTAAPASAPPTSPTHSATEQPYE